MNRILPDLVLEDVGRQIRDRHFDQNFHHQIGRLSTMRQTLRMQRQSTKRTMRGGLSTKRFNLNNLYGSETYMYSSYPATNMSTINSGFDSSPKTAVNRKHSLTSSPATTLDFPPRENGMEGILRGIAKGLSHGTRIKRLPIPKPKQNMGQIELSVGAFYNLGQNITERHFPPTVAHINEDMVIMGTPKFSSYSEDTCARCDFKKHQTVYLGKEEKIEKKETHEYFKPDLYSLYDLPEWYAIIY